MNLTLILVGTGLGVGGALLAGYGQRPGTNGWLTPTGVVLFVLGFPVVLLRIRDGTGAVFTDALPISGEALLLGSMLILIGSAAWYWLDSERTRVDSFWAGSLGVFAVATLLSVPVLVDLGDPLPTLASAVGLIAALVFAWATFRHRPGWGEDDDEDRSV
jgi:hypothetical protein